MSPETEPCPNKQPVVGVGISMTSEDEVARVCARWIEEHRRAAGRKARVICVTSVHGIVTAFRDRALRAILNGADIATPDGMPVVWAMRSFGVQDQQRVYGPDLMLALCRQAGELNHRIYLYGAREETLCDLRRNLLARFPRLQIAGMYSPPFRKLTAGEDRECTDRILVSGADIVFVGLSTPKQENWMHAHAPALPGKVLVGVGAAFDFHAGRVAQAPGWMQRRGLEWLFRLCMEPQRLWRRYLLETPRFLPLWALQKSGLANFDHRAVSATTPIKRKN